MFGSHLSIAGGLHNAIIKAEEYGFSTVQIFTKNQQQWRVPRLTSAAIEQWKSRLNAAGFTKTTSHASYLINLASPDEVLWRRSVELFAEELRRCIALGIPYCIVHPGAHMGAGEAIGLARVARALNLIHSSVPADGVMTCLECTAGRGSSLGHRLEHLAGIIEQVEQPRRVGVCLDTAHLFAAGYDFRGRKYDAFLKELKRIIGIRRVKAIHLNDSKKPLGSHLDRHEHIGRGTIGLEGFRPFVQDERWRNVPKILETPKEKAPDGRDWDVVNFEALMSLR